ncbi:MAG TPA: amidohydrolase family protein [Myxococcales bacterium]|nr:amidohydrolase family protein [Myxococcales bacterium]
MTLPGFVNAHTHLYSGLAPLGMPPAEPKPTTFLEILQRVWWRLDRALDADTLRASARYYLAEALLAGTTTLVDHHESPSFIDGSLDVLADAAQELGVRLAVCYGATERNRGRTEALEGLAECRRFARANRRTLVRALVGLHASFTASDDTLREAGALARELGTVVHVHVAEDRADVDDAKRRGWAGPLERLLACDALPRGSILAHGVHLDAAQVRRASEAGGWLVQNPRSNEANGVGYPAALGEARWAALGTDGFPSDMAEEREALFRLGGREGREALQARAAGGAKLAGELFDAVLAGDAVEVTDWQAPRPEIVRVRVAGQVVVERGQLVRADLAEIRARAAEAAPRLWQRLRDLP